MKHAFSLIELLFVLVVMGILSSFGADLLKRIYESYILSNSSSYLTTQAQSVLNQLTNRLQYRIKDSVIARNATSGNFKGLLSAVGDESVLEWIGFDGDGQKGLYNGSWNAPVWSGFIDLNHPDANATLLISPESNTTLINSIITDLRPDGSTTSIDNAALFFIGSHSDITTGYGWQGSALSTQNGTAHPVTTATRSDGFKPKVGTFSNVDVYEYYYLAWSAYAVKFDEPSKRLTLYYDYQPWEGESYTTGTAATLMENVTAFSFHAMGDMIKVVICLEDPMDAYSVCREKAIF